MDGRPFGLGTALLKGQTIRGAWLPGARLRNSTVLMKPVTDHAATTKSLLNIFLLNYNHNKSYQTQQFLFYYYFNNMFCPKKPSSG